MTKMVSDFLFTSPSALSGAARVIDLFGQFDRYNRSLTPRDADFWALYSDWVMVGQDVGEALVQWGKENGIDIELVDDDKGRRLILRGPLSQLAP